jgi:hypothetical protein
MDAMVRRGSTFPARSVIKVEQPANGHIDPVACLL